MGMYTEFVMAAELIDSVPNQVIDILEYMLGETRDSPKVLPDHPLFQTDRWRMMLTCDSAYFAGETYSKFNRRYSNEEPYILTIRSNFKNYNREIKLFLDWIGPYLDMTYDPFIGYFRNEEDDDPVLIYYDGYSKDHPIKLLYIPHNDAKDKKISLKDWLEKGSGCTIDTLWCEKCRRIEETNKLQNRIDILEKRCERYRGIIRMLGLNNELIVKYINLGLLSPNDARYLLGKTELREEEE